MNVTIYASFPDAARAEQALAALLDQGAQVEDLSALFPADFIDRQDDAVLVERATAGLTFTTIADAMSGARRGAGLGLGLGALTALASLIVPGFGIVTGNGALATALIGVAGVTAGGGLAGGVAGFLRDQGIPHRVAGDSEAALENGRGVLAIQSPTGSLGEFEVRTIINNYGADTYGRIEASPAESD